MNDATTAPDADTLPETSRVHDHTRVPMIEHIQDLRQRGIAPYLSIGHRLGQAVDPEILDLLGRDLFESNTWVSAVEYEAALDEAEALAADAWGADRTFYLVDGSSAGNHAVAMAGLQPGDDVLVSRDLHWSLLVGIILAGANPIYVSPDFDESHDVGKGVSAETVQAAMSENPNVRLVMIVSPSWCGVTSEIGEIAVVAHSRGVPLFVDEAWGPHFHFHEALPDSAMAAGADVAVTSVHKILPAVSQASALHVQGTLFDRQRLTTAVRMMSTTSPMLPIVATLDAVRRQMATEGREQLERTIQLARWARAELESVDGFDVLSARKLGLDDRRQDVTKLVIDVHGRGFSGYEVERMLNNDFAIAIESADRRGIVANFNLGETQASAEHFVGAIRSIAATRAVSTTTGFNSRATGRVLHLPEQAMTPRDAYFSPSRQIRLRDAVGEVAAELVTPYPPGIPVLAPGEVITQDRVDYLHGIYAEGAVNYGNHGWSDERLIAVVDRGTS